MWRLPCSHLRSPVPCWPRVVRSAVLSASAALAVGLSAAFVVASLQGANLLAKAQRSPVPVERFKEVLFGSVLKRIG